MTVKARTSWFSSILVHRMRDAKRFWIWFGRLRIAFGFRQMLSVFLFYPKGYGLGLPGVYAAWALVIAILYPYCRWVAGVKARRRDWWLSYL
jgi:hypothetical protein